MSNISIKDIRPQIFYYIRRKLYNHAISLCDSLLSKKGKEPTLLYWKAFATGFGGNINDALRQFEGLQGKREIQYPISLALIYFHKQLPRVDYDAVDTLNAELSAAEDVTVGQFIEISFLDIWCWLFCVCLTAAGFVYRKNLGYA